MRRIVLLILLLLIAVMPLSAQDLTLDSNVELEYFLNANLSIQGLRPVAWIESPTSPGVYVRARDYVDITAVIIQVLNIDSDALLERLQNQLRLADLPEQVDTVETEYYTWQIYRTEFEQRNQNLILDIALTAVDGQTYFIMLQTNDIFYDDLHEQVFVPVVEALAPVEFYEDENGDFAVPIPNGWTLGASEDFTVLLSPEEAVIVYVEVVETDDAETSMLEFWQIVDPDFEPEYSADDVRVVTDAALLGGLDEVVVIDFVGAGEPTAEVRQGVARVLDNKTYLTLIDTSTDAFSTYNNEVIMIDRYFRIPILTIEATQAP